MRVGNSGILRQMKRTPLRKKSKDSIRKVQDELWQLCRKITFSDFGTDCYTCEAQNLKGSNLQCGHFIPKAACGAYLKYDLRNLRPQCMRCNIHLGGHGAEFYKRMIQKEGTIFIDELMRDKQKTVKAYDHYLKLIEEYSKL